MGPVCLDLCANLGTLTPGGQQALDNIVCAIAVPMPLSEFSSRAYASSNQIAIGPYSFTLDGGATVYLVSSSITKTGNGVLTLSRPL